MITLTDRQQKWFAAVLAGLERDTGKTLDEWVAIARTCPETKQRARQAWLKAHHGLGQNRAMQVLNAAFPSTAPGGDEEEALRQALWADPAARAVLDALEATIDATLPDALRTQRKGFTAWSRSVQFAAIKPVRNGAALLGLGVTPDVSPLLVAAGKEAWSERLKSKVVLASAKDVTTEITQLLQRAAAGA